ncbi:cytosine deaminase [Salinigranum rubrum]|uniref:Cytosine deaminase n=1 Tax=Salinigranum rubrum TaxID=755307 RepID=A0A2I8VG16_9EURY|nr:amidohydrolase family protein [Salinigranum rubrum]AUV80824.1 cytosine deaminase [Salinigranum rubrum]
MEYDLLVRTARLPGVEEPVDIGIVGERIERIDAGLADGDRVVDAEGGLVAGGFVDCHVHLDKALIADSLPVNESGTLEEAIENIHGRKRAYTVQGVRERATRAIEMHVRNGCTRIRTHVDVDTIGGLTPLKGVLEAREACAAIADVQVVAFPQEGIVRDPGAADLLDEALDHGADAVGGMPDNERTDGDTRSHIDHCLDLARRYDVPVDMHVDETDDPTARSLEVLASRVIETELETSVTAGHTCALAAYDETHAQRVIDLLVEADLRMVTNPPTNLLLQGRHDQHPRRRGLTRVDQLLEAGLTVAAGQDCIRDGFYPYGRASMIETALVTAHAAHLQTPAERAVAWSAVTDSAAAVMDLDYGLSEGSLATFNVFESSTTTPTDVLRTGSPPQQVVHEGRLVAENTSSSTLYTGASTTDD